MDESVFPNGQIGGFAWRFELKNEKIISVGMQFDIVKQISRL
jgi:hypothetical protein